MCGLTGILIGKKYNKEELAKVKELFTHTLLYHEERGREATGVIAIWPDSRYTLLKQPIAASEFIETREYLDFLDQWDADACTLLGHTRKPTKGPAWNKANNHPIIVGDTVGVHNGTIRNDDHLFASEKLPRAGEVDSEIIFSMLNTVLSIPSSNHKAIDDHLMENGNFVHDIQQVTGKMAGDFTTLSVNLKRPKELLLLKYNQPMSFHYSEDLDTLFFTSRYIFLRKAFGRSVITEALPGKSGYLFTMDEIELEKKRGEPLLHFPIHSAKDFIAS